MLSEAAISDTPGSRLKRARTATGFDTIKAAAERFGFHKQNLADHEADRRGISPENARDYARAFKVKASWLLFGDAENEPVLEPPPRMVPVVGYVGAGAEAHLFSEGQGPFGEVEAPEGSTDDTVAVEIRGESLGALFNEWQVFYDNVQSPVRPELYNKLCVVGLPDGRVLVKQLKRASDGRFHLISNTEGPLLDQDVIWAAKVKTMTPR